MEQTDYFSVLAEHMKQIRKEEGLTQKEMAAKLGIGIATLSKLERGIIPPRLSCSVLFRVQKHFGVHPKDLFAPV